MDIPEWNHQGVVPPVRPGVAGHSSDRAPYPVTMQAFVRRFGGTAERRSILRGLLTLRHELGAKGLGVGFQWLDGSFNEHVEATRGRPPGDVDVVTFVALGDEGAQRKRYLAHPELFDHATLKERFKVDHYYVDTTMPLDGLGARTVAYWDSMWSHRRGDLVWKGFVQVALDPSDDDVAAGLLDELEAQATSGAAPADGGLGGES